MTLQKFIEQKHRRSEKTAKEYGRILTKWAKDLGYDSPDAVIADIRSGKLDPIQVLDDTVGKFIEAHRAPRSIHTYFPVLKGFLMFEEVGLNEEKLRKITLPHNVVKSSPRSLSKIEIVKLLNFAVPRARVAIAMLATSGMRINELCHLKVGNIDFEFTPTRIMLPGSVTKTRQPRDVFITREAADMLKNYLGTRKGNLDSYVLADDGSGPVSTATLRTQIERTLVNANLHYRMTEDSPRHAITPHDFRRFFSSKLNNAQMNSKHVETLLGHSVGPYNEFSAEELGEAYLKCEHALTFLSQDPKDIRESIERLQMENEELKRGNETLQTNLAKIDGTYQKQIGELEERMVDEARLRPLQEERISYLEFKLGLMLDAIDKGDRGGLESIRLARARQFAKKGPSA